MNRLIPTVIFCSTIVGAVSANVHAESDDAMIARGRSVAQRVCTACHVVSPDQEFAPILRKPAPRFDAIANKPATSAESLRAFLTTTHRTIANPDGMPNPQLTDQQVEEVIRFILSLRDRK